MKSNGIIERVETPTGHYYRNPQTGQQIPGVTTILKALPKEALTKWQMKKAVNLALDEPKWTKDYSPTRDGNFVDWLCAAGDREAFKAADVGTNAHEFAELHMTGQEPDIDALGKKEQKHAKCYLDFVRDYQPEPVLVEKVLVYVDPKSGQALYAGTMDLIAKLTATPEALSRVPNDWEDGLTWILDYKASAGQARSSHGLQAAAYRHSTHYLDEEGQLQEMLPVDKGAVILLNGGKGDSCYRMYELDTSRVVFAVFRSLLTISNFQKIEDRIILREM